VGYLLQRMESFLGLAILTTNMKSSLDKSFQRRLRFAVDFPFPDALQRQEIWARVFPKRTPVKGLDYGRLAALNMTGGNIKNIALNAAFLAGGQGAAGGDDAHSAGGATGGVEDGTADCGDGNAGVGMKLAGVSTAPTQGARVSVTIDRLVLRGMDPAARTGFVDGLKKELARVLADPAARAELPAIAPDAGAKAGTDADGSWAFGRAGVGAKRGAGDWEWREQACGVKR